MFQFFRKLFSSLVYLKFLNLEHNQLSEVNFVSNIGSLKSLQILLLSHNFIQKLDENLQCTHLRRLELKHNQLKRFFVDQFLYMSTASLSIDLMGNVLESVDFRNLNISAKNVETGKLFINLGEDSLTCNCHTLSLLDFLTHELKMNPKLYDTIEVLPKEVFCKRTDSNASENIRQIDKASLTCPLNFPHQKLCPSQCICVRRPSDKVLTIACQNISIVPHLPPYRTLTDIKLSKIQLRINGNSIERLPSKQRDLNYNDVTEIYASHNSIRCIVIENIPDQLELLDLRLNRLKHIPSDVIIRITNLSFLLLKDNPWNCTASADLIRFVKKNRDIVKDFNMIQCSNGQYFLETDTVVKCSTKVLMATFGVVSLLSIVGSFFLIRRKREDIVEWIFQNDKHNILESIYDQMKLFDAIVFATDYDLVFAKYITSKLVDKPNRFKIGFSIKDWSPNQPIPEKYLKSLRNSRRAIVIMTEHWIAEDWRQWNYFNTNARVIFITRGRFLFPKEANVSNKTFVKFGDPWFWDHLKYAIENRTEFNVDKSDFELQPLKYSL